MSSRELHQSPPPPLPFKTKIALWLASAATDATSRANGTVNRFLFNLLEQKTPPTPTPLNGVKSSDITVDPTRNLWFRLFVPSDTAPLPILIFFHGGGFAFLSPDAKVYNAVCSRFARKLPAIVVSVNYRLSPEHKYPSQYNDGFDVLKFLDHEYNNILPENADLSRCFLIGDSAGANLAHHVAIRTCNAEFTKLKVIGLISIQPFFGGNERTESETRLEGAPIVSMSRSDWVWKAFLPEGSDRDHEAANVSGPNSADISGLEFPRTMVVIGGFDPLRDWQKRYYEWVKRNGKEVYLVDYPNAVHAFYLFPELPEASELIDGVKEFINKQP